jgi:hypothetical protein
MNIETLLEKINLFDQMVIESGFARDVEEYLTTIAQPGVQGNLVALKGIADDLIESLQKIKESGLPEALDVLFPKRKVFTEFEHLENLQTIVEDPEMDTATFYTALSKEITALNNEITADKAELTKLKDVFSIYVTKDEEVLAAEDKAIMAIIFRDFETIKSLKNFARVLERWNRTLLIYHQLVSSASPKDIELLEIQNGSIEVIFDIKADVAIDLVEVFRMGLYAFGMYLSYKAKLHEIIPTFLKNKKLLDLEKTRETIMLDSVKDEVAKKLLEQHKLNKKTDKAINNESIDTKIEQVSSLITEQIIKGNELKLLSAPQQEDEEVIEGEVVPNPSRELRDKSQQIRTLLKQLDEKEVKLLADRYGIKDDDENESHK